jgi:hypothetical protein
MNFNDLAQHEIQFSASNHTEALAAAANIEPSQRTERFTRFAEARALAVQVTLDTLRPVLRELIDGPEETFTGSFGVRATVTPSADGRRKSAVFTDPRGEFSMAVALNGGSSTSAVFFGNDGVTAQQAAEAVHQRGHDLPGIASISKIGDTVIAGHTSPADDDRSVYAVGTLAGFLKEIRPAAVEAAISEAESGNRHVYVTPGHAAPFLRATAAALAVDGFIAWGCVNATLDILWADILTAEFAGRAEKASQLAAAILSSEGPGYQEDEASWAEETPVGTALLLLARDDLGVRIETALDTLTATLVDYETGSPTEGLVVIDKVSSQAPHLRSNAAYSARLATNLGNFAFAYLDDHHDTLCINEKKATHLSP